MKKSNVTKTRRLGLCTSCEVCSAACAVEAITMENKFGQFLPKVDSEKCTNCGLCLEICPGIDIDPFALRYEGFSDNTFDEPVLESYTAYSNDPDIRRNSASGGLITNLNIELIIKKEFDAAFVLHFDIFDGKPARLKATNKVNEIIDSAKSKYIPASVYNIVKTLKKGDNRRYIIVGTPCQIYGIKKFVKKNNEISTKNNLIFLGLFCDRILNFNIIRYFEDIYGKLNEKLTKFEFKTKEKYGWPGYSKTYFDSGRELIIDRRVRMQLKRFFQLDRCLFCLDKLNRLADISFGDCYIEGKSDFNGKSSVIVRTKKGKEIFDKYSYLFTLEKESIEEIRKSQSLIEKEVALEYTRVFIKENNVYPDAISDYEINRQVGRRLLRLQRYINWGKNYNINRIRFTLFSSKIRSKLRAIFTYIGGIIIIGIIIGEALFIHLGRKMRYIPKRMTPGNIIITGGELFNKGAQAMTFTVVDQIKRRFQNKNIYLFSTRDFNRRDEEKSIYKFDILPWDLSVKIRLLGFWNKLFIKDRKYVYLESNICDIIKKADSIIDVSGYALSSRGGLFNSVNYLLNIIIAEKYSVPFYILPQSIGPFDYPLKNKILLYPLMKLYLKYPKRIFPREKDGLRCVRKFSKKNVEQSYDVVLQNKGYDLSNIYNKNVHFGDIKIEPNSVGIIPNLMVINQQGSNEIYSIYDSLMIKLINDKKTLYILRHSYEDLDVCKKIKGLFPGNDDVKLLSADLNAIELENIIKQFDFLIASRYHAIIHSYKNGVPVLAIGWATKYLELLENFYQLDYFFDCRNNINTDEINNRLDKMIRNWKTERERVINKMNILNKENIFDTLFGFTKERRD